MMNLKEKLSHQYRPVLASAIGGILLILLWYFLNNMKMEPQISPAQIGETGAPPVKDDLKSATSAAEPASISGGLYKDGTYRATSPTPWGDYTISINVINGRWDSVNNIDIPDSPPSKYAANLLAAQALQNQGANIDGVSGATYSSRAFNENLIQISQQSKK